MQTLALMFFSKLSMTPGQFMQSCRQPKIATGAGHWDCRRRENERGKEERGKRREDDRGKGGEEKKQGRVEGLFLLWCKIVPAVESSPSSLSLSLLAYVPVLKLICMLLCFCMHPCTIVCACVGVRMYVWTHRDRGMCLLSIPHCVQAYCVIVLCWTFTLSHRINTSIVKITIAQLLWHGVTSHGVTTVQDEETSRCLKMVCALVSFFKTAQECPMPINWESIDMSSDEMQVLVIITLTYIVSGKREPEALFFFCHRQKYKAGVLVPI